MKGLMFFFFFYHHQRKKRAGIPQATCEKLLPVADGLLSSYVVNVECDRVNPRLGSH